MPIEGCTLHSKSISETNIYDELTFCDCLPPVVGVVGPRQGGIIFPFLHVFAAFRVFAVLEFAMFVS